MPSEIWYNFFIDAYKYSTNYLIFSVTVVIASILCVWIYEKPHIYKLIFKKSKNTYNINEDENEVVEDNEPPLESNSTSEHWPITRDVKQQLIEKMSAEMTKEQMELEKEVETKQLETIFKLLQDQEDKLQVSSMEQLKEQMKLYRK